MKKIINGKKYDTSTATFIADGVGAGESRNDFHYFQEELYRKKTGEYFLTKEEFVEVLG